MAQHDMNIANQGFPATRADLNNALQAIATNNSGTSAPSTTFANQWFYNETSNKLFIRNEANNAFIEVATLDQTNNEWQITTGVIQAKDSDGLALKTDDGTTRLFIKDSDGAIGIGTSSPATKLSLVSDGAGGDIHVKNGSGQNALLELAGNNNTCGSTSALFGQVTDNTVNLFNRANAKLVFGTNNTARWEITSAGHLKAATNGLGIDFSAVANSTSGVTVSSSILDDYEEGIYTYTLTGSTSGSETIRSGFTKFAYTKIGRFVKVTGRYETLSSSGAVGNLRFSLPFAQTSGLTDQADTGVGSISIFRSGTNFETCLRLVVFAGDSHCEILKGGSGTESRVTGADVDSAYEGYFELNMIVD